MAPMLTKFLPALLAAFAGALIVYLSSSCRRRPLGVLLFALVLAAALVLAPALIPADWPHAALWRTFVSSLGVSTLALFYRLR